MNESIKRWRTEGPKLWQQLSMPQRITLGVVAVGVIAALIFFTSMSQQVEYATVYSGLTEKDAGTLVTKLKESNVPYELADGGTTIKVPSSQVAQVRLDLAAEGLPSGESSVGYELFDQSSFGMTDFAQKLNYQRALEGELSRTINSLSAVESSRVHIVIPEEELYTDKQTQPTASVVLKLRSSRGLQEQQIQSICNLVAGSVEGMKPESVTVIDSNGNTLSSTTSSNSSLSSVKASNSQMEAKTDYQDSLEKSVQSLLTQVLGTSKVAVQVNADLDWDQVESDSETYSPNGTSAQVRSAKETTETYGISPSTVGGIPGTSSNIPSYQGATGTVTTTTGVTDTSGYQKVDKTTNYELSKVVAHTVKAPGAVKKLSVAVILDSVADDAQIQKVQQLVSAAVGIDTTRGDVITVASMPFDHTSTQAQEQSLANSQQMDQILEIAKVAVPIVALLIALFFVRSLARGLKPKPQLMAPVPVAELEDASQQEVSALPTVKVSRPTPSESQQKRELVLGQVSGLTRTQPAAVASLVKSWIDEK